MGLDYKSSGVDIEAGYRSVELMKEHVRRTMRPEVLGGLGGFSGAFSLEKVKKMERPVLLSGTDGVGTKLKIAFLMDRHDTVGIDCVAMCVNDVACAGGEPLFFLDYIACGKNVPEKIAEIVSGVCEGCIQSGAALFPLPVIGIPMHTTSLGGRDSLYSIVQMPSGIPVATVAIGGAKNAGLLAVKILAVSDKELLSRLKEYSAKMADEVAAKDARLQDKGYRNYK